MWVVMWTRRAGATYLAPLVLLGNDMAGGFRYDVRSVRIRVAATAVVFRV